MTKATCYKCGREIEGVQAIGFWPKCPECETLDTLKEMKSNSGSHRNDCSCKSCDNDGSSTEWSNGRFLWESAKYLTEKAVGGKEILDILSKTAIAGTEIKRAVIPEWVTKCSDDGASITCALLCFFFGPWGAHFFYLNQPFLGIIFLASFFITFGGAIIVTVPLSVALSVMYFMMDADEFRKKYLKKDFKDNFKARLCMYNLMKYGIAPPPFPPATFMDCILTDDDLQCIEPTLNVEKRRTCFILENDTQKNIERNYGMSWQEWYLRNTAIKFPELAKECDCAIQKIRDYCTLTEWDY